MKRHNLKILPQYYEAQIREVKHFEIRKHDRDFKVGDEIKLNEIDFKGKPTGNACLVRITYILTTVHGHGFEGLEDGYCIMSTELIYKQ